MHAAHLLQRAPLHFGLDALGDHVQPQRLRQRQDRRDDRRAALRHAVAAILERLREAHVDAALDDFGTGYSSLGYVQRFPLKMIKIDRSFVEPLGNGLSPRSSAIVAAILALAQSLGLDVVAEGIETEEQRAALVGLGCGFGQGYLFGRPAPAASWLQAPQP